MNPLLHLFANQAGVDSHCIADALKFVGTDVSARRMTRPSAGSLKNA